MRSTSRTSLLAGLAAGSLVLAACSSGGDASATGGGGDGGDCEWNIGYAEPAAAQEIDAVLDEALIAAGEQAGVCVTVLDAALDVNKQLQDVNQFIAQGMDAIIVFPLSPSSLNAALERAQGQGIKVIGSSAVVTDEQPTGDFGPYDALFEQNSAVGGAKLLSDYVNQAVPAGGNALGVGIGVPVPSLQFMLENYQAGVTTGGGSLNWLATVENPTDDIAGAQQVVSEATTRFQGARIDAVLAYNTSSAVGARQALRGTPSQDAVIVGQNGDQIGVDAINNGQMDAMTDLVPWRQGLELIDLVQRVLQEEDHPTLTFGRVELYTADNIADRRDWDEAVEAIRSGELTCENAGCISPEDATRPF
ncbi:sugar ABC transporter substrate-binding protein [Geodermatophilus sp. CPCC 206100]|uniref:sugar ABC transporter substrate-binding protein n=1 Tax=Geodermatophilus sp. CPCC 206100 TaxID=3020054 RepID=UPI003AFF789D